MASGKLLLILRCRTNIVHGVAIVGEFADLLPPESAPFAPVPRIHRLVTAQVWKSYRGKAEIRTARWGEGIVCIPVEELLPRFSPPAVQVELALHLARLHDPARHLLLRTVDL